MFILLHLLDDSEINLFNHNQMIIEIQLEITLSIYYNYALEKIKSDLWITRV